eukprot:1161218-Pelagomonas_calceolata.AAC.5
MVKILEGRLKSITLLAAFQATDRGAHLLRLKLNEPQWWSVGLAGSPPNWCSADPHQLPAFLASKRSYKASTGVKCLKAQDPLASLLAPYRNLSLLRETVCVGWRTHFFSSSRARAQAELMEDS